MLSLLTALMPLCAFSQTRRALVIGLGEQLDSRWGKINGDRDVPLIVGMLEANGFDDIRTLVNSKATKNGIVKSIKSLGRRCRPGDIVYIHFSGHGQRVTDLNGDETDDRWDEAWIPYDAYRAYCPNDRGEKHLTDDELSRLLTDIRAHVSHEGSIVVCVDACHSGDSTRGVACDGIRGVLDDFEIPDSKTPRSRAKRLPMTWVTLSACKDYQINCEHPLGYGRLSYALHTMWPTLAGDHDNSSIVNALARQMRKSPSKLPQPQTPTISNPRGEVFSVIFQPARPN